MPYSITTRDGITIDNIPDDVAPDAPELKARVAKIRAGGGADALAPPSMLERVGSALASIPDAITGNDRATPETQSLPAVETLSGLGGLPELQEFSMASLKANIGGLFASPKEFVQVLQANYPGIGVRQDEKGNFIVKSSVNGQEYAIPPGFSGGDVPKVAAGALAALPAARAGTLGANLFGNTIGKILGAGAAAAGTQGAIETSQAATGGEFNPEDVGAAGLFGGGAQALGSGVGAARRALTQPQMPTPAIVGEAARAGVPLMTTDVVQPSTFVGKTAQATGERIPFVGTGGQRQAQQTSRVEAVKTLLRDYGADVATAQDEKIAADLVKRRGDQLDKYKGLKDSVLQPLESAGAVPVNNAIRKIDSEIARLTALGDAVPPAGLKVLTDFRSSLQGKTIGQIEELRKLLGDQITAPELGSARSLLEKIPSAVYGELRNDIEAFVLANGGKKELTKLKVANARLREGIEEASNARLKAALNNGEDTPETVTALLFSNKKSDVQRLARNLTPQGRAAARVAILQRALTKAGGVDELSPQKFANEVQRLGNQVGILFEGSERARVEGLVRVLKATQRASTAAAAPPTGVQAVPFFLGTALTDLFGSAGAATGAAAGIGLIARAYESKPVRDALLRIRSVPPASRQEVELIRAIRLAAQQNQGQPRLPQSTERPALTATVPAIGLTSATSSQSPR